MYLFFKRFGLKSEMIEVVLERDNKLEHVHTYRQLDGYSVRDIEFVVASLYEVSNANALKKRLQKLANRGTSGYGDFRLERLEQALYSNSAAYDVNIGSLRLEGSRLADNFDHVSFQVQIVNSTYFVLYASFHFNEDGSKALEDVRLKDISVGSLGFSFIPRWGKYMFSHTSREDNESQYSLLLHDISLRTSKFLFKYLSAPLEAVTGTASLYKTKERSFKKIRDDIERASRGYVDVYNGGEMLLVDHEKPQLKIFLKSNNVNVSPGYLAYPNFLIRDFSAIFLYKVLDLYITKLRNDTNVILRRMAHQKPFSLRWLKKANSRLIVQRYHMQSIDTLLKSPAWDVYIRWVKRDNTAIQRLNKSRGKARDYDKGAKETISSEITANKQLIDNALSRVESELSIKNTASNNSLSRTVFIVTVIALIVAVVTIFTTLYPDYSRNLLCHNTNIMCKQR